MKTHRLFSLIAGFSLLALAVSAQDIPRQKAFPTAEGWGQHSQGGRGGRVIFVTNLNDSGPGSLREACEARGPRIVIFRVAGIIALKTPLVITEPYITIAGQTAPGDGVCLKGRELLVDAHDTIIRYLRVRLGDEEHTPEDDTIAIYKGARDTILDHCSASWSVDETLSATHAKNVTVQWCFITESMNKSTHRKGAHGYGSLINGDEVSYHHNLYAHHSDRTPRPAACKLDFRNNVIYDFNGGGGYNHGQKALINYVGNYIIPGPSNRETVFEIRRLQEPWDGCLVRIFFENNINTASKASTADNRKLLQVSIPEATADDIIVDTPFELPPFAATKTDPPEVAYQRVLAEAGATLPVRDAVDKRIVEQVKNRTGGIINSQKDVGGWPEYKSGPLPVDSDNDGMPDAWEIKHGLNPNDPSDGNLDPDGDYYTNIEEFLNGTDPNKSDGVTERQPRFGKKSDKSGKSEKSEKSQKKGSGKDAAPK